MDITDVDRSLIGAAFDLVARKGWHGLSVAEAARVAGLPLDQARMRVPSRVVLLMRFGALADAAALADVDPASGVRDRLFGMVMRRIDVFQAHRDGVIRLLQALPTQPLLGLMLAGTSLRSMGWLLEGAGISAHGPIGRLRAKGMLGVWLWALRAWQRDTSIDLSATMAALDTALTRAEQLAEWFPGGRSVAPPIDDPGEPIPANEDVVPEPELPGIDEPTDLPPASPPL